jgi:RNA polymerase-binding transcription factor DksA
MVHTTADSSMTNPIELPDIENIEAMEQAKQKAINSLELVANGQYVKCQKCAGLQPTIQERIRPTNDRIDT